MKRSRWLPMIALLLFALLLGGCINIQQEYWLYEDGSAKVGMDVGMSEALLSMGETSGDTDTNPFDDLKSEFNESNPNIKNVQVREYTDKDLKHFAVTFEVPDFKEFLAAEASDDSEFNITLTRTPDDNIQFKQITQLDTGSDAGSLDVESMGPVFKDMYWSVIVHVPQVISTNGERLDNSTVQWKIPMADIFAGKAPGELTMVYNPRGAIGGGGIFGGAGSSDSSWILWLVGGIVLLLVAGGAAYYFLVYRKRPAPVSSAYGAYTPAGGYPPAGSYPPPGGMPPQSGYPPQWNAQSQPGVPPQWGAQPQPGLPPQWGAQPQPGQMPPQQWSGQPQPGTPGAYPQQPPPPQYSQTPPAYPPAQAQPPQPPAYPAYPQYPQAPQYPPAPAQGGDYYPPYPPPQQPPAAPPQEQPPVEPADQS